ncbi:flagellar basal body P-ring formation protein FlgA [Thermosulfurimonas marina]|uniref:Flagella basal body P-ring formation protein FlgA n=1 Tax=Thermosulfurimonas marina TaxID=2047767 RepID=A0A6H1WTN0_9BACT|nr:flagellar basal body P-ring formation chaperone FlgA [Thermosulfurimonas marina]QJA06563.1 flagellar basal body P-ring formation protein FlgA [Thermosulfurimonas marina]
MGGPRDVKEWLEILAFLGLLFLWTFLALFWTGSLARARTITEEHLREVFRKEIVSTLPWPEEAVEITRFSAEPLPLEVPEGAVERVRISGAPHPGSNTLLVDYLLKGRLLARVRVLGFVEVWVPVAVLKRPLPRGAVLSATDLTLERRPLTRLPQDALFDLKEAVGKELRVGLPAGRVLRRSQIRAPALVHRNQIVRIVARSAHLTVTARGQARQDGRPGEIIRVRNLSSKKEIYARVTGPGVVEVTF